MAAYAYYHQSGWKTRILNSLRAVFRLRLLEDQLQRLARGRMPSSFLARLIPPEYTYPKASWREVERHGIQLRLDLSNATDHGAFFDLKDAGDEALFALVKDTDIVVDIGANIGIYSLRFARSAAKGRVICFEPHPDTFARLRDHVRMNGFEHLIPQQYGIGPRNETLRLYEVVESNSGMNRILPAGQADPSLVSRSIVVKPLKEAIQQLDLPRIDLIKIDVEGFEMDVLHGSEEVIRSFHPVLFIELDDENLRVHGASASALVTLVRSWGYTVRIAQTSELVSDKTELHGIAVDILCSPQ